jgi:signal peptidase II
MNQAPDNESPNSGDNAEPSMSEGADASRDSQADKEPAAPEPVASDERPPKEPRPSVLFLGIVSIVSLALDLGTKWWALTTLEKPLPNGNGIPSPVVVTEWLTLLLARNRGGAWGLLQTANEEVRKPFFLIISVAAIVFIVYLYRKIHPRQHALKWGLPLVLGGAIGNLVDRVRYGWVIDFIDYRAEWVRWLNEQISKLWPAHGVTDHWPTFNIADVAICIGVGLMAIDMFTSRKVGQPASDAPPAAVEPDEVEAQGADKSSDADDEPAAPEADPPPEQSKV